MGVMAVLVLSGAAARAEDDVSAQARTLYERGMAHFQLAEYDDAIAKWQEGFRLKPVPEFLYNIGQAYRLSNRPDKAIQAYKAYLRMSPKAENRVEVERHIAALQRVVDQSKQAANAPPTQPTPVKPEPGKAASSAPPSGAQAAAPEPAPPAAAPPPSSEPARNELTASAPPREKPITKRAWFWPVVVGGAAIVAGAIVVGVVLGTRDNTKTLPGLTF